MSKTSEKLQHIISMKDHAQRGTAISKFKGLTDAKTHEEAAKRMGEVAGIKDAIDISAFKGVLEEITPKELMNAKTIDQIIEAATALGVMHKLKFSDMTPEDFGEMVGGIPNCSKRRRDWRHYKSI